MALPIYRCRVAASFLSGILRHHGLAGMGTYHDRGKSQAIAMALGFGMFLEDGDGYCKFNGLYMASPYEEPPIHKLATSIYIIY